MTTTPWPQFNDTTPKGIDFFLRYLSRTRNADISEFKNLNNRFIMGRKVGKIPSASADVVSTDALGDFNYDASYLYILIDNSGTPAWRRASLGSW